MNHKETTNVNKFEMYDNVLYKSVVICIQGSNLNLEVDENLTSSKLIKEILGSLKGKISTSSKETVKINISLSNLDAATLKIMRERLLQMLRTLQDFWIEFKTKCEANQEDKTRLEKYLARLPLDSLEIQTITKKIEVLEECCVKAWKADAVIGRIRELNRAVTQLMELAEEKKATQELYENFGRALEGAMRLSYEAENLIKEANE